MDKKIIPNGNIKIETIADVGQAVRAKRVQDGLTQVQAAALCGVGTRFLSELENGKATAELGKVVQVLKVLGLELSINKRGWSSK